MSEQLCAGDRADLVHPEIEAGIYAYVHGIDENNKSKLIMPIL